MRIRPERTGDEPGIYTVNALAFGRPAEADLVDALRTAAAPRISLVAEQDGVLVGHVLLTRVTVLQPDGEWVALGLGPVAVLPAHQRQGIGSELVRASLQAAQETGFPIVFVVGHPEYYPRFGFVEAAPCGLLWDQEVPSEAWMVVELTPGALAGRTGTVSYRPEFIGV